MITFAKYKQNVLRFVEKCAPSVGIFDAEAWEQSKLSSIIGPDGQVLFIRPEGQRLIRGLSLNERIINNDWAFASTPGGCESLEGGHSAVETLYLLGELQHIPADSKFRWVEYFNHWQDRDTGYYLGPYVPARDHHSWLDGRYNDHPWAHMHDHLIASLCPTLMLLGGQSRYKLSEGSMTGRFLDRIYLEEYLNNRDWNNYQKDLNFQRHNPWWMGNEFWFPGCILWQISVWEQNTAAGQQARTLLDQVWYRWHDQNMGLTGFWYGNLDGPPEKRWHADLAPGFTTTTPMTRQEYAWVSSQIMGGAHQLWLYDYEQHPIPLHARRRQTDLLLSLQQRSDGLFGLTGPEEPSGNGNCTDVDCMTLLSYNFFADDYRRTEIKSALARACQAVLCNKLNADGVLESNIDRPFYHNFNSYQTLSCAGCGNILNQSFYLWAVIAGLSVLEISDYPDLASFIEHRWPQVPSHWLWFRQKADARLKENL